MNLVAILGSVTPPGRMSRALQAALDDAPSRHPDLTTELIDLAGQRIAFADGRPPEQLGDETARIVGAVQSADAVLLASPVYRASFSGSLKNLLDHVPLEALQGKPVGILAMGATHHHYLGVDRHLRDVLNWFGALVPPTSVYLASSDFVEGKPTPEALADVAALIDTLIVLRTLPAPLGPTPLAARGL